MKQLTKMICGLSFSGLFLMIFVGTHQIVFAQASTINTNERVIEICDRTLAVQKEILRQVNDGTFAPDKPCNEVTDQDFQKVTEMYLRNKLEEIQPQDFERLTALEIVDISNNELRTLPDGFLLNAPALTRFDASHNALEAFPNGFLENSSALEWFSATKNALEAFPDDFLLNAPDLVWFYIGENPVRTKTTLQEEYPDLYERFFIR